MREGAGCDWMKLLSWQPKESTPSNTQHQPAGSLSRSIAYIHSNVDNSAASTSGPNTKTFDHATTTTNAPRRQQSADRDADTERQSVASRECSIVSIANTEAQRRR